MKKIYTLIILFFVSINLNAQFCGTEQFYLPNNQGNLQPSNILYDASYKHVFNVKFHIVYNDNGVTRTNSNGVVGLDIVLKK